MSDYEIPKNVAVSTTVHMNHPSDACAITHRDVVETDACGPFTICHLTGNVALLLPYGSRLSITPADACATK